MTARSTRWSALIFPALVVGAIQVSAQIVYTPYAFTNLAGDAYDAIDGTGGAARFWNPAGVAGDAWGIVYVADTGNHTIRRIGPGQVVTTIAGLAGTSGSSDGVGSEARFNGPSGLAVDGSTNVYVADTDGHTIRRINPAGVVITIAGLPGTPGTNDGVGAGARFDQPWALALDGAGTIYLADRGNHAVRKLSPSGTNWVVTTLAGSHGQFGTNDGAGNAARFCFPQGVTLGNGTNIYVADSYNDTIRKITLEGAVTTLAGLPGYGGRNDGMGSAAQFTQPTGIAADADGNIYVGDQSNHTIRKVTPAGMVTTVAGYAEGSADGVGSAARFRSPCGVGVDATGAVYVADRYNSVIRKVTAVGTNWVVTTPAGMVPVGSSDGIGNDARFYQPYGVGVDTNGNVFVADSGNHTIRMVTASGVVQTIAGKAGSHGGLDGVGSASRFYFPCGVAADDAGVVYVADTSNHTIRQITPVGTNWVVTTIAGRALAPGTNDGPGNNARFYGPSGVAADLAGDVYVADYANHTIRKAVRSGTNWVVSTIAGWPGSSGTNDGTGNAARFYGPNGVAVDLAGRVYVADYANGTVRMLTPVGTNWVVTTLAGSPLSFGNVDGLGSAASFSYPGGVAVDRAANVYVADPFNQSIRRVTPAGAVTTLGGWPGVYGKQDGWGGRARFWEPFSVAVDGWGTVFVADQNNCRIARGTPILQFDRTASGQVVSNAYLLARLIGPPGSNVVLEASADFSAWSPIQTNTLPPLGMNLSLPLGTNQSRFLRARLGSY